MKRDFSLGKASTDVLAAESPQKALVFTYPECGGHNLNHLVGGLRMSVRIEAVTEGGEISWDHYSEEVSGNGEIRYSCRDCDFDIPYMEVDDCDFEEEMDDESCVVVWMRRNCHEHIDLPQSDEQERNVDQHGLFLKFACPHCGAHEFRVFRLDTDEVTPIEYLSEDGELEYGRMRYVGGERWFSCLQCDYRFEIEEDLEEGKALAKWLMGNCTQD